MSLLTTDDCPSVTMHTPELSYRGQLLYHWEGWIYQAPSTLRLGDFKVELRDAEQDWEPEHNRP